ncbi:cobalt-precorrin-4 C(11)-methyltransferase [Dethiosulfatarculus sandiegensis]|uniref:Cobalt-precorrin-4 C(11)-methyltransferase n=1 Tax=Dethiosulfatarculus sandiegensis TaxID=1429043 RepID=A0A0D2J8U6_9BACT|nr:cobalt-precorrin-4 C(11)-methyltransferase [Dethiosulfatarculus sandiegensis]
MLFVGAGPGDPELVTVAGKKALEMADLVIYAGSLVSLEMLKWCQPKVRLVDSSGLVLEEVMEYMTTAWAKGERVVRLHTGDPSLYGAIREQIGRLMEEEIPWKVIPGVTAAFSAAAGLGLEYTLPEACQTLIFTRASGRIPVPEAEDLAALADHGASLAIYLSASLTEKVSVDLAGAYGKDAPLALVYRSSWPDQKVVWSTPGTLKRDMAGHGLKRQVLILAGPGVEAVAKGLSGERSKLYDGAFAHGFRPAKTGGGS